MKNIILDPFAGSDFFDTTNKALALTKPNQNVEFEFNGVRCIVSQNTNPDLLYRDYSNSWRMDWKTVGPDCQEIYDPTIQAELDKRNAAHDEKMRIEVAAHREKEEAQRKVVDEKVKDVEIQLKDAKGWKKTVRANKDPYGKCAIDYAEAWAKLMQVEIDNGISLKDCAERTSHELGFFGITGFMYGCAVSILSQCWIHGEDLRKWHNKEYNHEGEGVVNPAIISIGNN